MEEKKLIKNIAIKGLKYVLVFIILICMYMITLFATSLIPSSWMKENVTKSSETLEKEGERKSINLGYKEVSAFLFSDALMVNTAYSIDSTAPLESMLLARKNYIPGQTLVVHEDRQNDLGASAKYIDKYGNVYQTKELYGLMHGDDITDSYEYARYWHGYLILLRPLLVITTYQGIRILFLILMIALVGLMIYLIAKKLNIVMAGIFFLGLLSVNVFAVTQSFNEVLDIFIAIIASIYLLLKKDLEKNIGINFFVIGSITVFMDLLTAPLVTLGIPLILYFLLTESKSKTIKENIITLVKLCACWAVGYAFTWITKWIITAIICNRPIIQNALGQAKYRGMSSSVTYLSILRRNFLYLSMYVPTTVVGIITIYIIVRLIIIRKQEVEFSENFKKIIPYIFIGILPFAWYFVMGLHSIIHSFFTYRILAITVICVFIITVKIFETSNHEKAKLNEKVEEAKK